MDLKGVLNLNYCFIKSFAYVSASLIPYNIIKICSLGRTPYRIR